MSERYLANENFPANTVAWLRHRGNDVLHAAEALFGHTDEAILAQARLESRILLTFDRDFGELIYHRRAAPARGAVLFRLKQQPPSVVLPFLQAFFESSPILEG